MELLKTQKIWVCWNRKEFEKTKDGKHKIPLNPKTGGNAQSNNSATWATYETATKMATKYGNGVGFMFDPKSNIGGIDIDIKGNPEREQQAQKILKLFNNTYAERTPSGGYHIIFYYDQEKIPNQNGRLDPAYLQKTPSLECYLAGMTNRYFTFTGNTVNDKPINDVTEILLKFLEMYMKKPKTKEKTPLKLSQGIKSEENRKDNNKNNNNPSLLQIMRKSNNAEKFSILFDKGDISIYNDDESAADIALCNILAFFTQGDYNEIDALFRQSALYREKWERQDYRENTIQKAISICNNKFYKPKSKPTQKKHAQIKLMPSDFTDVGEALILEREYGNRFRYSGATGYLVYNGQKWEDTQEKKYAVMQRLTTRQLKEARSMMETAHKKIKDTNNKSDEAKTNTTEKTAQAEYDKAKEYYKFVLSCRSNGKSNGVLSQVTPHILININDLDSNPFYLNTPSGTIDLKTGETKKHNPTDYCTKITAVSPSTKGKEIFIDALKTITQGEKDLENYIQEFIGMAAIGKVYNECLGIAYGEGANGKSTLFNTIARVLGDYAGTIAAETLMTNDKGSKNWDYAEIRGKRLIIAAETEEGKRLSLKALKIISSTDEIHAEKKFKDPFKFTPSHSTILYTNHLPKVGSDDDGTWRRLITIPFNAKIEGDKDIKNYADYLFENAGEYILAWVIEGAKRFITNNFKITKPECVETATKKYRDDNDWLSDFIDEFCKTGAGETERASIMLEYYSKYCTLTGNYKRHDKDLKAALERKNITHAKTSIGAFYYGIAIRDELKQEKDIKESPQT